MISDVDADEKAGAIIGRFERGQHLKKIIQRIALPGTTQRARSAWQTPPAPRQHNRPPPDPECPSAERRGAPGCKNKIGVETRRQPRRSSSAWNSASSSRIRSRDSSSARSLMRQSAVSIFCAEHRQDELDVFSRELGPAIRLNHFHLSIANIYSRFSEPPTRATRPTTYLPQMYSKIGSMQKP